MLSQASQGKVSEDELIDRLMGILGHLVQRKTLKVIVIEANFHCSQWIM